MCTTLARTSVINSLPCTAGMATSAPSFSFTSLSLPCAGIHQAWKLLILVSESKGITTVPSSRPPGRRILYALRTTVLILSADCTVTIFSEYICTASVFSSCAGTDAFTSACIHEGASPATARNGAANRHTKSATGINRTPRILIARRSRLWLHNDLLFIARPHRLIEASQRPVVLGVDHQQTTLQRARQVQRALVALHFECVLARLPIPLQRFRYPPPLPPPSPIHPSPIPLPAHNL